MSKQHAAAPNLLSDTDYQWRLTLTLQHEAVPNSVQSWENTLSMPPERMVVSGATLTLKMLYDPRSDVDVTVRYFPRGK